MLPITCLAKKRKRKHLLWIVALLATFIFVFLMLSKLEENGTTDAPPSTGGRLGDLILSYLTHDLPFTVFLPFEKYNSRISKVICKKSNSTRHDGNILGENKPFEGGCEEDKDMLLAIASRVFGFSAVPKHVSTRGLQPNEEIRLESVSGFNFFIARHSTGSLLVNNLVCEQKVLKRGLTLIYMIDGILMDSQFKQSLRLDNDADESDYSQ